MIEQAQPSQEDQQATLAKLEAIAKSLVKTRDEAVTARGSSGIEDIWREDEEHYEGIDDLNRGEKASNYQSKPPGQATPKAAANTSTEFVNITRPYVDAAAAKVGDILLPTDERSWSLSETPVPELIDKVMGNLPPNVTQGMQAMGATQEQQLGVQQQEALAAQQLLEKARTTAKKAETRIEDWHIEGQFHREVRKAIDDCCKLGSGVLKGPVPVNKKTVVYKDGKLIVQEEVKPVSKCISPWNLYPDGACGESIHRGSYVWEVDFITAKMLSDLKDDPDYVGSQIDLCMAEGPKNKTAITPRKTTDGKATDDKSLYQIWYFTGFAKREDLEAVGCECPEGALIPAIFTIVNDRVIKGALNPLDTGEFPYDVMPWQRRANMPWGSGVGRQIRTPQRIVVAGVRVMLTNAGRAAGPIFLMKNGVVTPANGKMQIEPWSFWNVGEDETTDDVSKAMSIITIPSLQKELMDIVQFGLHMAEDVTGLPLLLQGQAGSAPETLGGQQLVDRNASGTLRRVAMLFDDCITEPHVRRYYAWLLQYGDDDEKGEFVIDARGSTALVDREVYKNEVAQLLQASLNPAYGLDPKKTMAEHLRTTKKDPEDFQLSEEELQAQQQQQPQNPAVQVAQIKEQGLTQRQQTELAAESQEKEKDRQLELVVQQVLEHIEAMKVSGAQEISFAELKAELAGIAMKIRDSKDQAVAGHKVEVFKHNTQPKPQAVIPRLGVPNPHARVTGYGRAGRPLNRP